VPEPDSNHGWSNHSRPRSETSALPQELGQEKIESEVRKILQSSLFRTAPRHSRFLRFVIDRSLAGENIKEYVIGHEVYDRPASYDPRIDSIVRVEAGRLRSKLTDYYLSEGSSDPIRIELPKGTYVPRFFLVEINALPAAVALVADSPRSGLAEGSDAPAIVRQEVPFTSESLPGESPLPPQQNLSPGTFVAKRQQRQRRLTWFLAALALAALSTATIFYRLRRTSSAAPSSHQIAVLADLSNSAGDAVFNEPLQQAMILQFANSPLRILPPAKVNETLAQMGLPANSPVTTGVARELCQRTGSKLVLEGSLSRLDNEYVVGFRALNCLSGEELAGDQERVAQKTKVLDALAKAMRATRARLGESLASLPSKPVQAATTKSLEALMWYSDGIDAQNANGDEDALKYLNQAIEHDPNFASAYTARGLLYRDMNEGGKSTQDLTKAFQLRSGTSELEQFRISAFYYTFVTGELDRANDVYQLWIARYPNDAVPHYNWALNCNALGEYRKAISETLEGLRIEPTSGPALGNLVGYYASGKQLDRARDTYNHAVSLKLDGAALRGNRYGVAFLDRDAATMENLINWASDKPGFNDLFLSLQSDTDAFYGCLQRARDDSERAAQSAIRNGDKESAAEHLLDAALRESEFGNLHLARTDVARALALATGPNIRILAAVILARSGDATTSRKLLDALKKEYPLSAAFNKYWLPTINAALQLSAKRPTEAVNELNVAIPYELGQPDPTVGVGGLLYPAYLRGQAYLQLREGAKAATEFQKLVDEWGIVQNAPLGVLARLELARAEALMGDKAAARKSYEQLVTLWKGADPDLSKLKEIQVEYATLH
jgi:tetratricopeptide (TPR) repeat protein